MTCLFTSFLLILIQVSQGKWIRGGTEPKMQMIDLQAGLTQESVTFTALGTDSFLQHPGGRCGMAQTAFLGVEGEAAVTGMEYLTLKEEKLGEPE